jgi:hypothetical protein
MAYAQYEDMSDLVARALDMVGRDFVTSDNEVVINHVFDAYAARIVKHMQNVGANQHAVWGYAADGSRLVVKFN